MKTKGEILTDIVKVSNNFLSSTQVGEKSGIHQDIIICCNKINQYKKKNILINLRMLDILTTNFTKEQKYYNAHIASLNILTNDYFEQIKNKQNE